MPALHHPDVICPVRLRALDDLWIWTQIKNRKVDPWIFSIFFFLLLWEQEIFPNPSFCVLFRLKLRDQRERSFLFLFLLAAFFFSYWRHLSVCWKGERTNVSAGCSDLCLCLWSYSASLFFSPGGCLCAIFAISALKLYSWNFLTARVEQLLDLNIGLAYDKSRLRLL